MVRKRPKGQFGTEFGQDSAPSFRAARKATKMRPNLVRDRLLLSDFPSFREDQGSRKGKESDQIGRKLVRKRPKGQFGTKFGQDSAPSLRAARKATKMRPNLVRDRLLLSDFPSFKEDQGGRKGKEADQIGRKLFRKRSVRLRKAKEGTSRLVVI